MFDTDLVNGERDEIIIGFVLFTIDVCDGNVFDSSYRILGVGLVFFLDEGRVDIEVKV